MAVAFEIDQDLKQLVRLGLILLQSDETLENEFRIVLPQASQGVACFHNRLPSQAEVTPDTLQQMKAELPRAASLFPETMPLDAVAYCCTSGATVIGRDNVAKSIQAVHPQAKTTDPMTAVVEACRALNVKKMGLLTPYIESVSTAMKALLVSEGIEIVSFASFEQSNESIVAHIDEKSTLKAMIEVGSHSDCEVVFASCTNLRTFGVLQEAEDRLNKPVISSNQALLWHLLRLSGYQKPLGGYGRLLTS